MTFTNGRAGQLIYTINALVERDPNFTTTDAVRAGENGFVDVLFARANDTGLDVSMLKHWFGEDPQSRIDVDDLYLRWTNASETASFMFSDDVNGWLWLSSISVNSFLVGPYSDLPAEMR
jgi:hypothetical protein